MSEDTKAALPSDPDELEAEIALRRDRLASTVDELVARAKPQALAHDAVAGAKAKARDAVLTPEGSPRTVRIAAVVGAVLALVALVVTARRRTSR